MILFFFSCHKQHEKAPEKLVGITESVQESVTELIQDQLEQYEGDSLLLIDGDTLLTAPLINRFYRENNYLPAWTRDEKLLESAVLLLSIIDSADNYGLVPEEYNQDRLNEKITLMVDPLNQKINATRIYEFNILLTDAFFRLMVHLQKGRLDENSFQPVWKGDDMEVDMVAILNRALLSGKVREAIRLFEPDDGRYRFMKRYLAELTHKYAFLDYSSLPSLVHDSAGYMDMIWRILMEGDKYDTPKPVSDTRFISGALKSFYHKYGLKADSILHEGTLQHLCEAVEESKKRIAVNMERLKWEKEWYDENYLEINIPSFTCRLFACDTLHFFSKIICGRPETPSPDRLDSRITHFFIYPYWNVPFSIAVKEMLPVLIKDTTYLRKHHLDVLDMRNQLLDPAKIDWKKYSIKYFPFYLRQRDGDENTLGVLKFMFANKYDIYVHDTNAKHLFGKQSRALSHGCIRLEKAKELAAFITQNLTTSFNNDSLNFYMIHKERKKVLLKEFLPIHIRYYTCEADPAGITFLPDIYELDRLMMKEGRQQEDLYSSMPD